MKEESHLEEMRAAVRGDRERADQARRRSLENVRALVEPASSAPPEREPPPAVPARRSLLGRLRRR